MRIGDRSSALPLPMQGVHRTWGRFRIRGYAELGITTYPEPTPSSMDSLHGEREGGGAISDPHESVRAADGREGEGHPRHTEPSRGKGALDRRRHAAFDP